MGGTRSIRGSRRTTPSGGSPFDEDVAPPPTWDPWTSMPPQAYNWTCSACPLEWLKRATGVVIPADIYASRESTVYEIGYTQNINPAYGLMDASGAQLQRVLRDYGLESDQGWFDFDTVYALA